MADEQRSGDRKIGYAVSFLSGIVSAVIVGMLLFYAQRHIAAHDNSSQENQRFEQLVAGMESDILNKDSSDFLADAKNFRRKMDTDDVPMRFSKKSAYSSEQADLQSLAEGAKTAVGYYLDQCVDPGIYVHDKEQWERDCSHDLYSYVSDSLKRLHDRATSDDIYGK